MKKKKRKKSKKEKIIDIIYWTIIICITIIEVGTAFGSTDINISEFNSLPINQKMEFLNTLFTLIFMCFIAAIFAANMITVLYIGIKIAIIKHDREKFENIDFNNNADYYRDILPKYSAAVLSYIDDFEINKEDIVATILTLELKGILKIEDEKIILLDEKTEELEDNEKYILNKIKENTLKNINLSEYSKIVKKDAFKLGLVQNKKDKDEKQKAKQKKTRTIIITVLILYLIMVFLNGFIFKKDSIIFSMELVMSLILILIGCLPYFVMIFYCSYDVLKKADPYVRNDEGRTIKLKLDGLKKYLTDFSKINEKSQEELILWENYLIYAVIFRVNTKVVNEVWNKIYDKKC